MYAGGPRATLVGVGQGPWGSRSRTRSVYTLCVDVYTWGGVACRGVAGFARAQFSRFARPHVQRVYRSCGVVYTWWPVYTLVVFPYTYTLCVAICIRSCPYTLTWGLCSRQLGVGCVGLWLRGQGASALALEGTWRFRGQDTLVFSVVISLLRVQIVIVAIVLSTLWRSSV